MTQNWINVNEKQPVNGQQVLTWLPDHNCLAFGIYDDGKFFEGGLFTGSEYTETVSHWMPMPEPPKTN